MALVSSGQLSLNDIRVELGLSQSNVSLGSMSNSVGFTDPDAVSEFWGYSATPNYRTFSIINTRSTSGEVCSLFGEDDLTLYFFESGGDGSPACPSTGVYVYEDSALTVPFDGNNGYWKSNQCGSGYYIVTVGDQPNFIEGITSCG